MHQGSIFRGHDLDTAEMEHFENNVTHIVMCSYTNRSLWVKYYMACIIAQAVKARAYSYTDCSFIF